MPRVIPVYDPAGGTQKLFLGTGAVDNTDGSADALNMLQLIYDIAPNATVVMASPGATSTAGQMAAVIATLRAGDNGAGIPAANIIVDDLLYPYQNPLRWVKSPRRWRTLSLLGCCTFPPRVTVAIMPVILALPTLWILIQRPSATCGLLDKTGGAYRWHILGLGDCPSVWHHRV